MFFKNLVHRTLVSAGLLAVLGVALLASLPVGAASNDVAQVGSAAVVAAPDSQPIGQAPAADGQACYPYPCPYPYPIYPPGIIIICPGCSYPYPGACDFPYFPPGLPAPGATPRPTATLVPMPTPTPGGSATAAKYTVCPQMSSKIPTDVQTLALAEPWRIYGYNVRQNPNIPEHPLWNPIRTHLSLRDWSKPYSRCNTVAWKSSCP